MDPRLLSGLPDLLILDILSSSPNYGFQVAQTVLLHGNNRRQVHSHVICGGLTPTRIKGKGG